MDKGAWQATAHGVSKSQTQLSDSHLLNSFPKCLHRFLHSHQQCMRVLSSTWYG